MRMVCPGLEKSLPPGDYYIEVWISESAAGAASLWLSGVMLGMEA